MRFIFILSFILIFTSVAFAQTEKAKEEYISNIFDDFKVGKLDRILDRFVSEPMLKKMLVEIEKLEPTAFEKISKDSILKKRSEAKNKLEQSLKRAHKEFKKYNKGLLNSVTLGQIENNERVKEPFYSISTTINFKVNGKDGWLGIREIVYDQKTKTFFIMSNKVQFVIEDITVGSTIVPDKKEIVESNESGSEDLAIPDPSPSKSKESVFDFVEVMPEFPGGKNSVQKYINKNITYPQVAIENGIQGKVYAKFIVQEDGSVSDIEIVRDIGGGCGQEVVRLIKRMPNWKPGMQNGKPVPVRYTLPVSFKLK